MKQYELVIGLEVHCQLATKTKLFCGCPTDGFGSAPNSRVCPLCTAQPGVLPVLNRRAVELAFQAALALDCKLAEQSIFARKNYFYPDLPKAYQISQYDQPFSQHGKLAITVNGTVKTIGITRIHMEEDAGKLVHELSGAKLDGSLVDLNRAGVPLIEIVSEPDIRSSEEAYAYLTALKEIIQFTGSSRCDMEKGEMRCDANVSVRPLGQKELGTRTETKNLNSFKNVKDAIEYEFRRQVEIVESGGKIVQETRLWDAALQAGRSMRSKEDAHDYRYFPDPDLVPLVADPKWVAALKAGLNELPAAKRARFMSKLGLSSYDSEVLTGDKLLAEYFEKAVAAAPAGSAKTVSNLLTTEMLGRLNAEGKTASQSPVAAAHLGALAGLIACGTLSSKGAKDVFAKMWETGKGPKALVDELGLSQVSDDKQVMEWVSQALAANPQAAADLKGGKEAAIGKVVGTVMKLSKGKANPALVNKLIKEAINPMNRMKLLVLALLLAAQSAYAYDTIRFLEPIKGDEMARPVAAAAAADRLYVVDEKKNMMFLYDASGKLIKSVGRSGNQAGAFSGPRGVAVGPGGKVYVADTGNNRVEIFDRDGNFVYTFGEKGTEPGKLRNPESVAVGADGRIYVSDTGNNRIQVFTNEGILLFLFGRHGKEPGLLNNPTRIAVDPSDNVFVLDHNNERMQKFDSSAKFSKEYALLGNDFTVDQYGFLYVVDGKNGKVIEQSGDGFIMGRFGSLGTGVGQMKKAEGIAITPDGVLIILDTGNNRIHRVELTNKLKIKPLPMNLQTKMSVSGPSRAWSYSASVLAPYGEDLYAWLPKEMQFVLIDAQGKEKQRFGTSKGKGGEVTRGVGGMAAVKSSKVDGLYVTDILNHRLQQFALDGKWKSNVGEASGFFDSKKREGRMKNPNGVAINGEGVVYVADTGNQRIDAFSPEGVFLFGFGPKVGSYILVEPVAVAWDKAGFVYFVDKGLKRVFKCEPSGAYINSWGEDGDGPGEFKSPVSIAFDGQNYLYTLDSQLRRVSVHTKDGKWLADFFAGGKQERELLEPIAVSVQGDKLVIADKGKSRLVSYDLHPMLTSPAGVSTKTADGVVAISWEPVADPWTIGYVVTRATGAFGPWATAGETKTESFQDSEVAPYEKYWYRVATKAKTADVGPAGRAIEVFVAGSFNRSPVEISTITLGDIFAANYKWYLRNPMGTAVLTNNVNVSFQNVKLTFKLKDYMDFGFDTEIKKLEPKQTVSVPLIATLNNKVLEITEDTPIQAEFTMTYFESGKQQTVSLTKPLRLFSRNAITWQDPQRIANFVTRKDPPVRDFVRGVSTLEFKNRKAAALNEPVVKAMRIWNALSEYGLKFVANAANPFEAAHDDPNFPVDYTQFPRETLRSKAGQCSDLTSLYAAMLEDSEIRVAILDYPGHMTMMFDTEAEDAVEAGMPADLLIEHEGTMWAPVEVTFIGKPFSDAVSKAAYAYKTEAEKGRVRVYGLHKAWGTYEPVTMPPTDFSPKFPETSALERKYDDQVNVLAKDRYSFLKKQYEADIRRNGKDVEAQLQLGIIEYQFGNREAAVTEFNKVLALDPANSSALNNLGSVAFLEGDNVEAEKRYTQAAEAEPDDAMIWLNLVKTSIRLNKTDKARAMGDKAVALAPGFKPAVDSLIKGS